ADGVEQRSVPVRPEYLDDVRAAVRDARGPDVLFHVPTAGASLLRPIRGGHGGQEPPRADLAHELRQAGSLHEPPVEDEGLRRGRPAAALREGSRRPDVPSAEGGPPRVDPVRHERRTAGRGVRHGEGPPGGPGGEVRGAPEEASRAARALPPPPGRHRPRDLPRVRERQPGHRAERAGPAVVHVRGPGLRADAGPQRRGGAAEFADEDGRVQRQHCPQRDGQGAGRGAVRPT
ncbi:hypothetical protein THAOC_34079, partial [Thalassiosira oceanica]